MRPDRPGSEVEGHGTANEQRSLAASSLCPVKVSGIQNRSSMPSQAVMA